LEDILSDGEEFHPLPDVAEGVSCAYAWCNS